LFEIGQTKTAEVMLIK